MALTKPGIVNYRWQTLIKSPYYMMKTSLFLQFCSFKTFIELIIALQPNHFTLATNVYEKSKSA